MELWSDVLIQNETLSSWHHHSFGLLFVQMPEDGNLQGPTFGKFGEWTYLRYQQIFPDFVEKIVYPTSEILMLGWMYVKYSMNQSIYIKENI